jgi:hypothetical protein
VTTLNPTAPSSSAAIDWAYTFELPPTNWMAPDFNDVDWRRGPAGFGTRNTPNTTVRTEWSTTNIWLRRSFDVPAGFRPQGLQLNIFHDEDARVFLNGQLIAELSGFVGQYETVLLDNRARAALRPGRNVIAVTCRQIRGGQYIDVGIEDAVEPGKGSGGR